MMYKNVCLNFVLLSIIIYPALCIRILSLCSVLYETLIMENPFLVVIFYFLEKFDIAPYLVSLAELLNIYFRMPSCHRSRQRSGRISFLGLVIYLFP